jgi:type II secretory pathway pseudopilin PulG
MKKSKDSGATLVELIITIIVATIAAGLILSAYTIVMRVWHDYNRKVEASGSTWAAYLKIEHLISQSYSMQKTNSNQWVLYKSNSDSCILRYGDRSLVSSDSTLTGISEIDSFHLDIVDTCGGISPVWECGIFYSQGRKSSAMVWRTICRGNYSGTDIPLPFQNMPVQTSLYWDGKGK